MRERVAPTEDVRIRPVEQSDRHRILRLCAEIFQLDHGKLDKVWSWLFDENPAANTRPIQGWVLEASGEIVGHSGVIPQRFCVLGQEIVFSFATAICVLPQYRFHGLRLAHEFLTHEQSAFPLTNSGNEKAVAMYKFFGCHEIPGMVDNEYVWVLRFDRLFRRKFGVLVPLTRWVGPVLSYWAWARYRSQYVVEHCDRVDAEFDRLWEELSTSYGVLSVRNREYLSWRYFRYPDRPYQFFAARRPGGRVAGYVAYWFNEQGSGLRILNIVDLFCDHGNSKLVTALVQKMIEEARRLGADAVRVQNVPVPLQRLLKRRGFLRRRRDNRTAYRNNCGILSEVLSDSRAWYCSTADGDCDIRIWPVVSG